MYCCTICRSVSAPRQPLLKHVVYRTSPVGSIAKELPVCEECKHSLDSGIPLSAMVKGRGSFQSTSHPKPREIVQNSAPVYQVVTPNGKVVGIPKKRLAPECDLCGKAGEELQVSEQGTLYCPNCARLANVTRRHARK